MSSHTLAGPFLGALTVLCWAGYNVAAKYGIEAGMTPAALAFLRYAVPGVVALPMLAVFAVRGRIPEISGYKVLVLVALSGPFFGLTAVSGYVYAPLSHGLLVAPVAVFLTSAVLGSVLLGERPGMQRVVAAMVMFAGLAVLVSPDPGASAQKIVAGLAFFSLAGAMWGGYTVLLRYWRVPALEGAVVVAGWSALLALPTLGPAALRSLEAVPTSGVAVQVVMQGCVGGVVSVVALIGAVRVLPGPVSALLPVFTPVVATGIAAALFGVIPTAAEIYGSVLIAAGFLAGLGVFPAKTWQTGHNGSHGTQTVRTGRATP